MSLASTHRIYNISKAATTTSQMRSPVPPSRTNLTTWTTALTTLVPTSYSVTCSRPKSMTPLASTWSQHARPHACVQNYNPICPPHPTTMTSYPSTLIKSHSNPSSPLSYGLMSRITTTPHETATRPTNATSHAMTTTDGSPTNSPTLTDNPFGGCPHSIDKTSYAPFTATLCQATPAKTRCSNSSDKMSGGAGWPKPSKHTPTPVIIAK